MNLCNTYISFCETNKYCKPKNCPHGDDELFEICDMENFCPENCHCRTAGEIICNGDVEIPERKYILKTAHVENLNYSKFVNNLILMDELYITCLIIKNGGIKNSIKLPFKNLKFLNITKNNIKILKNFFYLNIFLEILILKENNIKEIRKDAFEYLFHLIHIEISYSSINFLYQDSFSSLKNLQTIIIQYSKILNIDVDSFKYLHGLRNINLKETIINEKLLALFNFKYNSLLNNITSEYFHLCCFGRRYHSIDYCRPMNNDFNSCYDLLQSTFKRILVHLIVIIGILGNILLIIQKLHSKIKPLNLIELTLMISDFLLSIYFLIILIYDYKYSNNYIYYDIEWRKSKICLFIEILASNSCLLSNFSLLLLTFERYLGINSLTIKRQENFKNIILVLTFLIILSIFLSILPIIIFQV